MTTYDQARWTDSAEEYEPLLSEKSTKTVEISASDREATADADGRDGVLPDDLTRDSIELPDVSEPEIARHYTRLSQMNYGVTSGPFPLGSCTMKYNPPMTEDLAAMPTAAVHPDRAERYVQGTLEILHGLQDYLGRIGGMDAVSLQPRRAPRASSPASSSRRPSTRPTGTSAPRL